jgi:sugar phosphate isomerase/epimerase
MKLTKSLALATISIAFALGEASELEIEREPRALYTYSFGGLELNEPVQSAQLLKRLGYAGIAVEGRGHDSLKRLDKYYESSDCEGKGFEVVAAYMAHRFGQYGFNDSSHRTAIDRIAGKEGATLWVWVRDDKQDGSITNETVEEFITGIYEYAHSKGVKVVLYPHYNTYYPTTEAALSLVEKINQPDFQVAINLCHELMSYQGDRLEETFERARGRIGAIILSGSLLDLDPSSVRSMTESTIMSLDESEYDVRPYLQLIKNSGFDGPIGFINFRLDRLYKPEDYLARTLNRWIALCNEVGLYERESNAPTVSF